MNIYIPNSLLSLIMCHINSNTLLELLKIILKIILKIMKKIIKNQHMDMKIFVYEIEKYMIMNIEDYNRLWKIQIMK